MGLAHHTSGTAANTAHPAEAEQPAQTAGEGWSEGSQQPAPATPETQDAQPYHLATAETPLHYPAAASAHDDSGARHHTAHGAETLSGETGMADTFAYLLDSNDAASWQQPGKISDYNPAEGDRIVLAGRGLADARLEVSADEHGQHLNITDRAGHTRSIDIAAAGGKPLTAADILSHVEIRDPQQYDPSHHSTPQQPPLPQEDNSHIL